MKRSMLTGWITPLEAQAILQCSSADLKRMIESGLVASKQLGKVVLVAESDVLAIAR